MTNLIIYENILLGGVKIRRIWIYRVLSRDKKLGGYKLSGYQFVTGIFKEIFTGNSLSGIIESIELMKSSGKEKISLIFKPPFDFLIGSSKRYEELSKEEIKEFLKALEA